MNALLQSTLVQTPENSKHDNAVQDFERDVWSNIPLQAIKQRLQHFADERDWNQYHTPRNLTLALVGEVGELAEIFQWVPDSEATEDAVRNKWTSRQREHLEEELSDVFLYLIRLSDRCGVDLPAAAMRKIQKNGEKYPAPIVRGSRAKYNEYHKNQ